MAEGRVHDEAFVTLATNDTYALGCLVLGSSLQRVSTTRQLVVMITSGVSESMRQQLGALFDHIVEVNALDSSDSCNLELLGRPDLSCTFTKFHCWRLTQFKKCVFMDADTLVLQNVDDLFAREELSAAPDAGWPDCFNSGVFVFAPSEETYRSLLAFAVTSGSFDGGDQGLLNSYFSSWATADIGKHLPFTYNVVSQAFYSYLPAFKQFRSTVKVVHFIGAVKPWHQPFNTATGQVTALPDTGHSQELLQIWWNIFMEVVQPNLDPTLRVGVRLHHRPPSPHPAPEHGSGMSEQHDQHMQHHHQQQQHHHPSHGHSATCGTPTTTLDVLFPYTPPQLHDCEPSDAASPPGAADGGRTHSQVMNVPVVYRDYHQTIETHYSEPPLSSGGPEHYQARDIFQGRPFQPPSQLGASDSGGNGALFTNSDGSQSQTNSSQQCNIPGANVDKSSAEVRGWGTDVNDNPTSKSGIVGDLANLSLGGGGGGGEGGSPPKRDDRERKLQWEQGQADYMGVDRFDNIMAKLDQKIADPQPAEGASPAATSPTRLAEGDTGAGK